MKKILVAIAFVWIGTVGSLGLFAYDINTDFPYEDQPTQSGEEAVDLGEVIRTEAVDPEDSASQQILEAFRIDLDGEQRATDYIKNIINWLLAISGLIALVVVIYGFYRLLMNKDNEEGIKNARKTIITAIVALFVIGFAWIIVSQFFDIFFQVKPDIDA